jgi:1,4-dihydroxy-2-naphthoate octaprenyltransferase
MLIDWVEAVRLKFLPQGIWPVFLGSAIAWWDYGRVNLAYLALAFVGMSLVQFGLTMLNDLVDYVQGTDKSISTYKNPYSGGSGVLADGRIAPKEMLGVIVFFYMITLAIGIYFAFKVGPVVLYIALIGFFISIAYTVPPFKLAYRGLGELAMMIGYGPIITLGAFYVQTGVVGEEAILAGFVPGLLMVSMILLNEIPDYEEDKQALKRNLTVRLGRRGSAGLYMLVLASVYAFVGFGIYMGFFPAASFVVLLSLPIAFRSVGYLHRYIDDRLRIAAANAEMVKLYSLTMLFFTAGFII